MKQVNTVVMSAETSKKVADAVSGEIVLKGKWKKASDLLMADGITVEMLDKPAKGEANPHENLHNQINRTIVSTFSTHVQSCLAKEMKTLSDVDKETKRYWTKQISSLFGKIRTHLESAYKLAEDEANGITSPRVAKTKVSRIKAHFNSALDILKSLENPSFDVTKVISDLKLLVATVKE
jgi:hypothetical protein